MLAPVPPESPAVTAIPDIITVVVVDDHDLLREGVMACLNVHEGISVVGGAASGAVALETVAMLRPDVVVVDLVMPDMDGTEVIRRLREASSVIGLIALSSFTERERVADVIRAGANGYLVKSVDSESLAVAVRNAAAGQGSFSPEVAKALATRPQRPLSVLEDLTKREREIAELIADGRTNAEIAQAFGLSVYTVKNHVSHVLNKLHARTRTEVALLVLTGDRPARGTPPWS